MTNPRGWLRRVGEAGFLLSMLLAIPSVVSASPFGQGVFGADVPFGSATSIAIALGGNVNLSLVPDTQNFSATGSHTLTVTSTDVVGYNLYVYGPNGTNMSNGTSTIPASANVTPAPLTTNSWGYNTDGSSNFIGMTTHPALIKAASGPYKNGDPTAITYGVVTPLTTGSGQYNVSVVYTVVAMSQ